MDVKYSTDTKIEDNSRMYKLQKAHFDQEINTAVSLKKNLFFPLKQHEKKKILKLKQNFHYRKPNRN